MWWEVHCSACRANVASAPEPNGVWCGSENAWLSPDVDTSRLAVSLEALRGRFRRQLVDHLAEAGLAQHADERLVAFALLVAGSLARILRVGSRLSPGVG